ncbi:hypothetical protein PGTUg99_035964 [Puccinia graminis f. sp. tritici]|uniref:Uncharacterized protein n=1 Tax=Puccinia graminis f. sp. tritici TaxID=56615 RepID=A0A5B0RAC7_PUCGR|nr:hypothetical protein PGTUg99_035964 [Puccinia graminis f. sp. tritici]
MTGSFKIIPTGASGESGDGGKPHSSTLYIGFGGQAELRSDARLAGSSLRQTVSVVSGPYK